MYVVCTSVLLQQNYANVTGEEADSDPVWDLLVVMLITASLKMHHCLMIYPPQTTQPLRPPPHLPIRLPSVSPVSVLFTLDAT